MADQADRENAMSRLLRRLSPDRDIRRPHKTPAGQLMLMIADHRIDCVLDVGANVGQTGNKLRRLGYRGRIVSFEPLSGAHAKLLAAAQGDADWIVAPRMAIGEEDGEITLNVSQADDMSSARAVTPLALDAIPRAASTLTETATLNRLDQVFDDYVPAGARVFLKIDTQGLEREVVAGASGIVERIHGLQMEMSLAPLYEGEPIVPDLMRLASALGFEPWAILPTTFSRKLARQLQVDGIFFRPE